MRNNFFDLVAAPTITAGPDYVTTNGTHWKRQPDDAELLEKTDHVRLPKETLLEFMARTGCGSNQIRTSTKEEIFRFVRRITANQLEDASVWGGGVWNAPSARAVPVAPKTIPKHFSITE